MREYSWAAEYESLKAEQRERIKFRDEQVRNTLVVVGAVFSVVLADTTRIDVLLVLPPVVFSLGWMYTVNDRRVSQIGEYLRLHAPAEAWEHSFRKESGRVLSKAIQLLVDVMCFAIPSVGALAWWWSASSQTAVGFVTVAVVESLLPVASLAYFGVQFRNSVGVGKGG